MTCVLCHRPLSLEDEAIAVTVPTARGTGSLCSYCQDRHGVTVTADADGWITDIQTARELRLDWESTMYQGEDLKAEDDDA
jgi:hypothetical protein